MADNTFIAINSDALFDKSRAYIQRALDRKNSGNLDEYQFWSSLALELLGKAALAHQHPSLIVDPNSWKSMFVAAGINITTDVKTITAKTLFERLFHLIPQFDNKVKEFCEKISKRRNAEIHSGEVPFKPMELNKWEAEYWHTCDTILYQMGTSLEKWLGASDATAPRHLLDAASGALSDAVKIRIKAAKEKFQNSKKNESKELANNLKIESLYQVKISEGKYDRIWTVDCPACGYDAFMAGTQTSEKIADDTIEHEYNYEHEFGSATAYSFWEIVIRKFIGEDFQCPACDLNLSGTNEIEASGLDSVHEEQQEREIEYEPDYGND